MPRLSTTTSRWLSGRPDWLEAAASLPLHDTHEHLQTEAEHLATDPNPLLLLWQYVPTDLVGAGLDRAEAARLDYERLSRRLDCWEEDFRLIEPHLPHVRHTGYGQMVARTLELVFGERELTLESLRRVSERMRAERRPGRYERLLDEAGICSTQANTFDASEFGRLPVRRAPEPPRHLKDLFIDSFLRPESLAAAEAEKGIEASDLSRWSELIDRYFADDAKECVAVKCAIAYSCDLAFPPTPRDEAASAYERLRRGGDGFSATQREAAEQAFRGWAIRHILRRAAEHGLPVKLHTGHYAGPTQPLSRISRNLINLQPLIEEHPRVTFILMHHAYPYGDAAATLAKSYERVFIDQCWAWAINPAATVRYLKEFLTVAPANKLFLFGGDLVRIEPVAGHADLARQGLAVALWQLVEEGWLSEADAPGVAERVCYLNQEDVFPQLRALRVPRRQPVL